MLSGSPVMGEKGSSPTPVRFLSTSTVLCTKLCQAFDLCQTLGHMPPTWDKQEWSYPQGAQCHSSNYNLCDAVQVARAGGCSLSSETPRQGIETPRPNAPSTDKGAWGGPSPQKGHHLPWVASPIPPHRYHFSVPCHGAALVGALGMVGGVAR